MVKSKGLVVLLIVFITASLVLSGCGQDKETNSSNEITSDKLAKEQVLRIDWGDEPPSLDPQLTGDLVSGAILIETLEGMIRLDEYGKVKEGSGMAKSWDVTENGTKYTFHLRDAKWSDGKEVTAQDFEYSWKRAIDPETASSYAFLAYDIKNAEKFNKGEIKDADKLGIKALDKKTLEVKLERPNPAFLSKLQTFTFLPSRKDLVEKWGDKYGSEVEYLVSCGPFKVTKWVHEAELILEKNEDYWDKENVKLQKVEGTMIKNSNTAINMYETGALDFTNISAEYLEKYEDVMKKAPVAATYYHAFNTENEFFKNKSIRKAFVLSIDRKRILDLRTNGMYPAAYGFVPPGMPGPGKKTFRQANGDLFYDLGKGDEVKKEAKDLLDKGLKELGKSKEDIDGEIKLLCTEGDSTLALAQIWQQAWKEVLGIDVGIEQATFKIRLDRQDKGDFDLSYTNWWGDYNDPMTFMDMWIKDGSQNMTNWSNPQYDKLIKKAQTTTGDERMEAMLEAEKILMEELPIAPHDFGVKVYIEKPYVKGVVRLPLQILQGLKHAYVLEH
ncbi:MAG: peptide ABC transporter substrate-binding protein [Firmicutes bacterium]|nr:peptide ABC transporter substrate-binding protein [Bacillota bacterium]